MRDHSWIARALLNIAAYAEEHGLMATRTGLHSAISAALPEVSNDGARLELKLVSSTPPIGDTSS